MTDLFHSGQMLPAVMVGIGHDDLQGDGQASAVNQLRVSSLHSHPARKG
ncbi:hypothetical protein [Amycolatopsis vastitatis]|nr:hypothetical protein [Amycolatopsis vastitatis]